MELLDRYLQAVEFFLSGRQRDDILRELSENLIAEMEDQESALGRPLSEANQAEILRRHGHPMLVAARYRPTHHLIGPVVFPLYLFVLKTGLGVALIVTFVLAAIAATLHGDHVHHTVEALRAFPGRALMVFAWTTLGFAVLDRAQKHLAPFGNWNPRSLPGVIHRPEISRRQTLAELFFLSIGTIWLLLLPGRPSFILGPLAVIVEFAPGWGPLYVVILAVTFATAVLHVVDLARPYWTRARSVARLAIHGGSLAVVALIARADRWVVPIAGATPPTGVDVEKVVDVINMAFSVGLGIAAVIAIVGIARELYRLTRRRQTPLPPDSITARAAR